MEKDRLISTVITDMGNLLTAEQLKQLRIVLVMKTKGYRIEKERNELIIYDETSDIAAYKNYFVSKKIQGLSPKTLELYKYSIDKFMRMVRKPFSEVTTNDIRLFLADRSLIDGVSNASLRRERGAICRFFKWLSQEEYIRKDPGARVEIIKLEQRLKEPFTEMELERLRASCTLPKELAIIELLMSTGCRVSELVSLTFENLDRHSGEVKVVGKGNKERIVRLNARAQVALLAYHLTIGSPEAGTLIKGRNPDGSMSISGVQKVLRKLGVKAGINNVHPHRFRRTTATFALRRGMHIERIMKFLGHASVDTTLLYAIVSEDDMAHDHKKYIT